MTRLWEPEPHAWAVPVSHVRRVVGRRPVLAYFLLAYALSWAWWVPLVMRGATVRAGVGWPTSVPGLLGPAVAAVIVTALVDGRAGLRDLGSRMARWRIGWTWWLVVAGTLSLGLLGAAVTLVTGQPVPALADFTSYTGIGQITPLGVAALVFLGGMGEETGWRGLAADRLVPDHGLTWSALVVGVGWAGWHLPLFGLVDSFRSMGVMAVGWFIGLVAGSVVLTFLYRQGHRSILLVAAWHTAFNLISGTKATAVVGGTVGSVLVICWGLWVLRRERVRAPAGASTAPAGASG
jgi:membrane protease YdiL (CAAX protease family)